MLKKWFYRLLGLVSLAWLSGCSTIKPDDYAETTPKLRIEDYFQGRTLAWGMFQDRFGKIRNRFKVDMKGTVKDGVLTLNEDFFYENGSTSNRQWNIKILGDGRYEGTAGDVIGVAKGKAAGHAFNWKYQIDLPIGDSKWRVSFDDWLFLQEDGVLINIATVSKWGITLGKLTFVFAKKEPLQQAFKP